MNFLVIVKASRSLASWVGSLLILVAVMPTWSWYGIASFLGAAGVVYICQKQRVFGVVCLGVALGLIALAVVVPVDAYGAVNTAGAALVFWGSFPGGFEVEWRLDCG